MKRIICMKSLETENWKKSKLGLITILISFSALHELDRSRVEVRNLLRKHGGKRGMELLLEGSLDKPRGVVI